MTYSSGAGSTALNLGRPENIGSYRRLSADEFAKVTVNLGRVIKTISKTTDPVALVTAYREKDRLSAIWYHHYVASLAQESDQKDGELVQLRAQLAEKTETVSTLESSVRRVESLRRAADTQLTGVRKKLKESESEVEDLVGQIDEYLKETEEKEKRLDHLDKIVKKVKAAVNQDD